MSYKAIHFEVRIHAQIATVGPIFRKRESGSRYKVEQYFLRSMVITDSEQWASIFHHPFSESGLTRVKKLFKETEKASLRWRIAWFPFCAIFHQQMAEYPIQSNFPLQQTHHSRYSWPSIVDLFVTFKHSKMLQPTNLFRSRCWQGIF
jgi:hypothetical protein